MAAGTALEKRPRAHPSSEHETSSDELENRKRKRLSKFAAELQKSIPASTPTPSERLDKTAKSELPKESLVKSDGDPRLSTFSSLNVRPWLVRSLRSLAVTQPTKIQRECIPKILEGRDCIGGSRTGSGKTIAFAVPILQMLFEDPMAVFAVVLIPTRELALQIYEQFKAISSSENLQIALIVGGYDSRAQAIELAKRPHIVVATPGRLADHVRSSGEDTLFRLRKTRVVVFDEADRLLSDGEGSMLPDINECLSVLPPVSDRQNLLFTATVTPEVRTAMDQPPPPGKAERFICEVDAEILVIPPKLTQMYLLVPVTQKESYLHVLLQTPRNESKSTIIFCNRTSTAELLYHTLSLLNHNVTSLYSKLQQKLRNSNLVKFRAFESRILVATDVASRGLDIPEVGLVINYDVPHDPDDYIHRVGRTARAGKQGEAVTFVGQRDVDLILAIEKRVGRKMIEYEEEKVNVETRVVRDALRAVNEKKREASLNIEENRDADGRKRKDMRNINGSY